MAGRDYVHGKNTNIVSELFSQLNELSDAISPRATSGVESEVGNLDYPSLTVLDYRMSVLDTLLSSLACHTPDRHFKLMSGVCIFHF